MDKWTGRLIGRMHNAGVSANELAEHMGVTKTYISMILNCKRKPKDAQKKLETAFSEILEKRGA
jgi:plasmid maintenance system antidote protein VapI